VKLALVSMPWGALNTPSLALSTLVPCVAGLPAVERVTTWYGNLRWAEQLIARFGPEAGVSLYGRISDGYFVAAGEWVFTDALHDDRPDPERTPFHQLATAKGIDLTEATELYRLARDFVGRCADELLAEGHDVFGFTTTFLQNVPSLALAREIKRRAPGTTVIFGGANCDGVQGAALHRSYPFVDYVVRGEGEVAFPALLAQLAEAPATGFDQPGLCWRDADGRTVANPQNAVPLPMAEVPSPDFGGYFHALDESGLIRYVRPELVLEGSRGCWWGAKHHCTFCGLNGNLMRFRSKPSDRMYDEIIDAVTRTRVLDVSLADNILDMAYLRDLLPRLAEADLDVRLFCETKSNLGYPDLERLARANVVEIQPGIENLSSHVLELMRKGVTGVRNIELLRNCETLGISVSWNYLYGFPGELDEDYAEVLRQASALVHLQPPAAAFRVALERFSPYFEDPGLGVRNEGPARLFAAIYGLPEDDLADLVYLFESTPAGIGGSVESALIAAVGTWRDGYPASELTCLREGPELVLVDRRRGWPSRDHRLTGPVEVAAYRELSRARTVEALRKRLAADHGIAVDEARLRELLGHWSEAGLVFRESDRYIALATGKAASTGLHPLTDHEEDPPDGHRVRDRKVLVPLSGGPRPAPGSGRPARAG
jgi:ribosomal peptide maturation radical SAM protein 1